MNKTIAVLCSMILLCGLCACTGGAVTPTDAVTPTKAAGSALQTPPVSQTTQTVEAESAGASAVSSQPASQPVAAAVSSQPAPQPAAASQPKPQQTASSQPAAKPVTPVASSQPAPQPAASDPADAAIACWDGPSDRVYQTVDEFVDVLTERIQKEQTGPLYFLVPRFMRTRTDWFELDHFAYGESLTSLGGYTFKTKLEEEYCKTTFGKCAFFCITDGGEESLYTTERDWRMKDEAYAYRTIEHNGKTYEVFSKTVDGMHDKFVATAIFWHDGEYGVFMNLTNYADRLEELLDDVALEKIVVDENGIVA